LTVLFSTLGFTPKLAMAPLRDHQDIKSVHLFCGTPLKDEGTAALKACKATANTLQVPMTVHRVKGAFDYDALLEAFAKARATLKGEPILVNASGGTRVMTMAATIFAFTNDVPLVYYDEYETTKGKLIPLRAFRSLRSLGESQMALLTYLRDHGSADMSTLSEHLALAPSTLSAHVSRLTTDGLVTVERKGKRRVVSVVPEVMKIGLEVMS
jgi:CRISPR locus-related DNA-binding protein